MYGIFTYIWVILRANARTYSIHGAYGILLVVLVSSTHHIIHAESSDFFAAIYHQQYDLALCGIWLLYTS